MRRFLLLLMTLCLPLTAFAGNIKDTDLITSNTFFFHPPRRTRSLFKRVIRPTIKACLLHDLGSRLTAKGYQIIQDPSAPITSCWQHRLLQHHQAGDAGGDTWSQAAMVPDSAPR